MNDERAARIALETRVREQAEQMASMQKAWADMQDLKESFLSCKSSKQLWSEVRERYGQTNAPLLFQLKKELRNISQDNSSVVEYFNKLKCSWDDMEELESYPDCTCGAMASCSCNLMKRIVDNVAFERVLNFLMGLGDTYETLRTNILAMDPVPNVNRVYSIIRQAEAQKQITGGMQLVPETSALSVGKVNDQKPWNVWKRDGKQPQAPTSGSNGQTSDGRWCNQCQKSGHTRDTCFVLHPELKDKYFARFPPKGNSSRKFSGNAEVQRMTEDTPLEFQANTSAGQSSNKFAKYDPEVVTVVYQDIMQRVQFKQSDNTVMDHSNVNFAGKVHNTSDYLHNFIASEHDWIIDSGASDHMSANKALFTEMKPLPKPILVGLPDGTTKVVIFSGIIILSHRIILYNVLFIPGFKHNLLSVGQLLSTSKLLIHFSVNECMIQDPASNLSVAVCPRIGGLYKLNAPLLKNEDLNHSLVTDVCNNVVTGTLNNSVHETVSSCNKECNAVKSVNLIHARLGHTSLAKMHHIVGIDCKNLKSYYCDTCIIAKIHKQPFIRSDSRAKQSFDLLHIDLWGPYKVQTLSGASYFLTVVDDHTRVTWTFLMKFKTQVASILSTFFAQVENQFNKTVKMVRSDNGTEIFQEECAHLFNTKGILHQRSVPGVPQQNGRVERKHRHLVETARAMLLYLCLPKKFWGESLLTTYVINKLPSAILGWKTPHEVLLGEHPSYDELRVLRCLCYAPKHGPVKDKFEAKGRRCVFIGYPYGQKAYKLYDLDNHKVFVSRDVLFHENIFPFSSQKIQKNSKNPSQNPPTNHLAIFDTDHDFNANCYPKTSTPHFTQTMESSCSEFPSANNNNPGTSQEHQEDLAIPARRSTRVRQIPANLKDFVYPTLSLENSTSLSSEAFSVFNLNSYPVAHLHSLNNVLSTVEPSSYK
ncbi:uncharacterized protein LOC141634162 [Silene latifolia]|uniref:uncharacterized protein LOC141634162 n=1 Tax=Silene latifolia TaxID=37657 RepID=UPI003D77BD76